ncbi:50S ribosomal protein L25/general stress protein Ctc [Brevibacterium linens]|uniref:Large ribosomal subunit protein bL25 n=2 Tax=Brevibacterium linens TaxID=1703 RepID=A0A2H1JBV8_BRELN|nr:50S ribosomal protein L25/general stress protein Ctc [Brevibacterium linens]KAB1946998.1 50S ribosomal protein L25/general stress protein Ctc [Brevibacterium linens ATCC 9172]SMX84834.1 LSU ribosomal protein L25P [Brevibacterium linens]SMX91568.1 LSU ribosomal protein L25P [Brevibacterium linens ATCC 9172]
MADFKLLAEARNEFGKGAARRIRRAGRIPAVIYGHGGDPVHVSLEGHATMLALKHANALLEIESTDGSKNVLAIARDVQIEPVRRDIEHLDLIIVKRGEKIEVDVPIHVVGEAAPGTMVSQEESTIAIKADATKLPEIIEVSIEGRPAGEHLLAGQVELPAGVELVADEEQLIVNVSEEIEMDTESDAEEESAEESTEDEAAEESGAEEASEEE